MELRIAARFRAALAAKGVLLLSLALVFGALLERAALAVERPLSLRLLLAVLFGVPAAFLGWTAALAFADAAVGRAVRVTAAQALRSRRSGVSFRLPDGRSAEFLLYNPWEPLKPGQKYDLVIGRCSRVLVEAPRAADP